MTQEQLLWRIIEKLNEGINSQHETIKFLMEKRIEQRQWVGLTDEEIQDVMEQAISKSSKLDDITGDTASLAFKIAEAKLREKNA